MDLLVVTEKTTKERNAIIHPLSSKDLKLLAKSNFDLNEMSKLKASAVPNKQKTEKPESKQCTLLQLDNHLNPSSSVEHFGGTDDDVEIDLKDMLSNSEKVTLRVHKIDPLQPETAESSMMNEDVDNSAVIEDIDNTIRSTAFNYTVTCRTLASYLEVCSVLGVPQRGLNALNFHNARVQYKNDSKSFQPIRDVRVYNALLKGFASKGDLSKLTEVLNLMQKEQVPLNVQSYVVVLECCGRAENTQHADLLVKQYLERAKGQGYTYFRLVNDAVYLNDEREVVNRVLAPYYTNPTYRKPRMHYNNHLVNHLNHSSQNREPATEHAVLDGLFTEGYLLEAIEKQLQYERDGSVIINSIELLDKPVDDNVLAHRRLLEEHFGRWEEAATKAFQRDIKTLAAQRSPLNPEPYFRLLPAKQFAKIIVAEARRLSESSESYSPTVHQLHRQLGQQVYARYQIYRKEKSGIIEKTVNIHRNYCKWYVRQYPATHDRWHNTRQLWQWEQHKVASKGATLLMDHCPWTTATMITIGQFLYHIVMHDLMVDVNCLRFNHKHKNYLPAFYTVFRNKGRNVTEEVKPHPVLARLYRNSMPETLHFTPDMAPMVCPPVPWTCTMTGGYLITPCDLVRLPAHADLQRKRMRQTPDEQLFPTFDALNQLSAVPWIINTSVLDVVLQVFNAGGSEALDVPINPNTLQAPPATTPPIMSASERYKLFKQKLQFRRKRGEVYSLWCDCLYRLSLANHFRDTIFWLPHNLDFRGRVYPIAPHLNHLGSDLARSILVFAESRPLGEHGLDWLKIHLVNLTGLLKRASLADRLAFANTIMDKVEDSAKHPLNGLRWWADSDEPWQTLACCMEIVRAIRSGDPARYCSHFPVHQDGSCNGLQHYAALGRDTVGAHSVNLTPTDTPQDVYSTVVGLVEKQRSIDAENGIEVAKELAGFIQRKVIKQTIMTTVYGVTRFGARIQIARQLKDVKHFNKQFVWPASSYLTKLTFDSLQTMFTSTKEIQDWFTACARVISHTTGQNLEWVTPLGLPIVQPYIKYKLLTASMYKWFHSDQYEKPNVMKQKNAFPPNFIHSLDSSHMMLTSLSCERAGITYVSVHDCYWTHPSTVHIMNKICREQFVKLHSEAILENLSLFFSDKFSYKSSELCNDGSEADLTRKRLNKLVRQLPKKGDFDIRQVLNSTYFFS